jgi:predicted nucleotidyltransferase
MGSTEPQHIRPADALFTKVQQRVLGILFGRPDRSFLTKEVIALAASGTGAVHRELKRLTAAGLITLHSAGWEKHYQANRESPVFEELVGLIRKTIGLVDPLREALAPLSNKIRVAFVYGSLAKGTDTASSDVDLMFVSEDLTRAEVYGALVVAERLLGRPVNPTLVSFAEWQGRRKNRSRFLEGVAEGPKLFVLGSEDDLAQSRDPRYRREAEERPPRPARHSARR